MGIRIALAGNPNCGKTTMFNDLTGASQYVGNWPGVTVEKKEGKYTRDKDVIITDLPGVYSLSPYSPEEIVTRDYLLDGGPDVVVNLVDATNLERNLYLTTQILDLGVPVVVALNMMDLVKKSGDKIDVAGLSKQLGCPIVETTALKGHGMAELMETAVKAAKAGKPAEPKMPFDAQVEEAITKIEGILGNRVSPATARWFAIKLFEGEERTVANMKLSAADLKAVEAIREEVENKLDDDAESIITSERYNAITHVIDKTMKRSHKGMTTTQKIDRVVTNRWLGLPIFVVVMALVYYLAISVGTGVVTDWANDGISGDGFLYTGGAAYEEAVGEWEGEPTSPLLRKTASTWRARPRPSKPKSPPLPTKAPSPHSRRMPRRPASSASSRTRRPANPPRWTPRPLQPPSKLKSPTLPTARGACGFPVWERSSATPSRRSTSRRGCRAS